MAKGLKDVVNYSIDHFCKGEKRENERRRHACIFAHSGLILKCCPPSGARLAGACAMSETIPLARSDKYAAFRETDRDCDTVLLGQTPLRKVALPATMVAVCVVVAFVFLVLGATMHVTPPARTTTAAGTRDPEEPEYSLASVFLPIMAFFLLAVVYPAYLLVRSIKNPIALQVQRDRVLVVYVQQAKNLSFETHAGEFNVEWKLVQTDLTAVLCFSPPPPEGRTPIRCQIGFGTCETAADVPATIKEMPFYQSLCRVLERELKINDPLIPVHMITDDDI